jgi:ABC-type multidrug transport system fused ATPase/permease subunit
MSNLLVARGNLTLVVIASRPSTVSLIGDVAFLSGGRIVDRGSHDELLGRCERYAALMESYESDRRNG